MLLFWIDNICVLLHAFWKLSLVEPLNQYFDIYSREHFISCHLICIFHNQYVLLCHFNNIGVYELAHHDWFALQSLGIVLHNTEVTRKVLTWLLYFTGWVQCYSTIAMRTRFPNVQPPATYTGCCRRVELSGIGERVYRVRRAHRPQAVAGEVVGQQGVEAWRSKRWLWACACAHTLLWGWGWVR